MSGRSWIGIGSMAALAFAVGAGALGPAASPASASIVAHSRFPVTDATTQLELVQLVVEFEPGAWTSVHTHGGQAINLVLEGEITLRHGNIDQAHRAGQSWSDESTQVHSAGNTGQGKARLLTTLLLPRGAPLITVIEESRFGPTVVHEVRFALPPLRAGAGIVQQVIDLAPGELREEALQGPATTLVIEGEVTVGSRAYALGAGWIALAGTPLNLQAGTARARVFRSLLVPALP